MTQTTTVIVRLERQPHRDAKQHLCSAYRIVLAMAGQPRQAMTQAALAQSSVQEVCDDHAGSALCPSLYPASGTGSDH